MGFLDDDRPDHRFRQDKIVAEVMIKALRYVASHLQMLDLIPTLVNMDVC